MERNRESKAATPSRSSIVSARFVEKYPSYQYSFIEFLTEHLVDVSRTFNGDLQQVIVLAIIGQVYLHAHVERRPESATYGAGKPTEAEPSISASRIADVTGISRQTVRRKLKTLEQRGWIERLPDASYRLVAPDGTSPAKRDLSALDQRAVERVARLFCNLERILAR